MANEIFTAEQEQQILKAYKALDEKLAVTELDVAAGHQRLMAKLQPEPSRQPRSQARLQPGGRLAAWNPLALIGSGLATGCVVTAALILTVQFADDATVGDLSLIATSGIGNGIDARKALADSQGQAMAVEDTNQPITAVAKIVPSPSDQITARQQLAVNQLRAGKVVRIEVDANSPLTSQELFRRAANAGLSVVMSPTEGEISMLVLNLEATNSAHRPLKRIAGLSMDYAGSAEFIFRQR